MNSTACRRATLTCSFVLGLLATFIPTAFAQLTTAGNDRVYQAEVGGTSEPSDQFGTALAAGDFNRDGYADLAIGTPYEDLADVVDAGVVYIAYGSAGSLAADFSQIWHQGITGVPDTVETDDRFGAALSVGDFNADGYDDLAIGIPRETVAGSTHAGAVQLLLGGPSGLFVPVSGSFLWAESFDSAVYNEEAMANFGSALATCDRNGDGRDDLIVGIPSVDLDPATRPGALLEIRGAVGGLTTAGAVYRPSPFSEAGDRFGYSLACGNIDETGNDDIFVGAPHANSPFGDAEGGSFWRISSAGTIHIVARGQQLVDHAGQCAAVGNLRATDYDHMIVCLPGHDATGAGGAGVGRLYTTFGSNSGLEYTFGQGINSSLDASEPLDHFASAVTVGDFDHDGIHDVVFGVPFEDLYDGTIDLTNDAGLVQAFYGDDNVTFQPVDQTFHWGPQFGFGALANDLFGSALAVGDFDKDGIDDLAIGVPGAEWSGQGGTGIVQVIRGSRPGWIFGDGFESGYAKMWSNVAP